MAFDKEEEEEGAGEMGFSLRKWEPEPTSFSCGFLEGFAAIAASTGVWCPEAGGLEVGVVLLVAKLPPRSM